MRNTIIAPKTNLKGFVSLPSSKSLSNRMLTIQALNKNSFKIKNLAESDDTKAFTKALSNLSEDIIDIGAAGTTMRFLTSFLALQEGERILTGSERMKRRPISELVNILREYGASIEYTENEGYPPLKIRGRKLIARPIHIKGNVSSQFISSLLLISPYLEGNFELVIDGKILSKDYILMTIGLMKRYGIEVEWNENVIRVNRKEYSGKDIIIESDWSSASYWFEIISLCPGSMVELTGLQKDSLQGDSVLTELYKTIGVDSIYTNFGLRIKNVPTQCTFFEYDFTDCPDLAQTVAVTLVAKKIPFIFKGLDNLSIKETDRIKALVTEFGKLGIVLESESNNTLIWNGQGKIVIPENHFVRTYKDHRMALAFSPLCIATGEICIEDPDVVSKSYPNYWKDLTEIGFNIKNKKNPDL